MTLGTRTKLNIKATAVGGRDDSSRWRLRRLNGKKIFDTVNEAMAETPRKGGPSLLWVQAWTGIIMTPQP